jgi:(2Fe-2S) ferredoxin
MSLRKRYVFVCINRRPDDNPKGSCAAKGSEEIYAALKGELKTRGLALYEARACTSSCLDVCSHGVTILVEPDHVFLGGVTAADVPAIADGLAKGELPAHLVLSKAQIDEG